MMSVSDKPQLSPHLMSLNRAARSRPWMGKVVNGLVNSYPLQREVARLQRRAQSRLANQFGFTGKFDAQLPRALDRMTYRLVNRFSADRIARKYLRSEENQTRGEIDSNEFPLALEPSGRLLEEPLQPEDLPRQERALEIHRTYPNFGGRSSDTTLPRLPAEDSNSVASASELDAQERTRQISAPKLSQLISDNPQPNLQHAKLRRMVRLEDVRSHVQLQRDRSTVPSENPTVSDTTQSTDEAFSPSSLSTSSPSVRLTQLVAEQSALPVTRVPSAAIQKRAQPERLKPQPFPPSPFTHNADIEVDSGDVGSADANQPQILDVSDPRSNNLLEPLDIDMRFSASAPLPESASSAFQQSSGSLPSHHAFDEHPAFSSGENGLLTGDDHDGSASFTVDGISHESHAIPDITHSVDSSSVQSHSTPSAAYQTDQSYLESVSSNVISDISTPSIDLAGSAAQILRESSKDRQIDRSYDVVRDHSEPRGELATKAMPEGGVGSSMVTLDTLLKAKSGSPTKLSNLEELSFEEAVSQMREFALSSPQQPSEVETFNLNAIQADSLPLSSRGVADKKQADIWHKSLAIDQQSALLDGKTTNTVVLGGTSHKSDLLPIVRRTVSRPIYVSRNDAPTVSAKTNVPMPLANPQASQKFTSHRLSIQRTVADEISTEPQESISAQSTESTQLTQSTQTAQEQKTREESASPAQRVDIQALAAQVYPLIRRRLAIERERLQGA